MKRGQTSARQERRRERLELIFYRGAAKTEMLRGVFGSESMDALWAGLYLQGTPQEALSMNREVLEDLTPPYASISFTLPTNDLSEHQDAKNSLDAAGIRYDESTGSGSAITGTYSPSAKVYWLSGDTLNRDIFRLIFEVMYGSPTLVSHRFIFTISPPLVNPEADLPIQRNTQSTLHWKCMVSTYYWKGLQLVSRGLAEESIELLVREIAVKRGVSFIVRNR